MKNFHQNLLIVLALGLCSLCVYQWNAQTRQRKQITTLNQLLYEKTLAVQEYTNRIATRDKQIAQMDARLTELNVTSKSVEQLLVTRTDELKNLRSVHEVLTNQVAQYIKIQETLESRLKTAYEGIQKQNAAIKELAAQRDEFVKKFNDSIRERNDIVSKYNDLVKQTEKTSSK